MSSLKRKACSNSNEQNVTNYKKEIIIVYMEQGLEKENALIQQKPQGKGEANMALTTQEWD
jgi:hypothetical protein